MRTSNGCWTCRLRRKKCDETQPICEGCAILEITCHFNLNDKPAWMDGGAKQEEQAEKVKTEIKDNARRRRDQRPIQAPGSQEKYSMKGFPPNPPAPFPKLMDSDVPMVDSSGSHSDSTGLSSTSHISKTDRDTEYTLLKKAPCKMIAFERSDTVLLAFYLENLLPFLFPFYRPSPLQGGRAWIFELVISSPIVRKATLCQSSYFFSLARGSADHHIVWDQVLANTADALGHLRLAVQIIESEGITAHFHGAVRVMASILQLQRFEVAVSSFQNWQTHLKAAIALFVQVLGCATDIQRSKSSFEAAMDHLGTSSEFSWDWSSERFEIPTAEQAAFRFSSALVVFDDIIASVALQVRPRLYEYHRELLANQQGACPPPIDLAAIVGIDNDILMSISEIATLDAWKQQFKATEAAFLVELIDRATPAKESLMSELTRLEHNAFPVLETSRVFLDVPGPSHGQRLLASRIWAHAALIYLSTVVCGWHITNADIKHHVSCIIELLQCQDSPTLLRSVAWPLCVAGCLAEREQEPFFRALVEGLQPLDLFGTLHKALEIMENVWRSRGMDLDERDLAMCFRLQDEVVLLV